MRCLLVGATVVTNAVLCAAREKRVALLPSHGYRAAVGGGPGVVQFRIPGFLSINEPAEIVVHFVTGALATYAGFSGGYGCAAVLYARVFGISG